MNKTKENLKKLKSFHNGSYGADIDKAIKAIEQTMWIPVNERLPVMTGNYLVTVEANDGTASIKYQMVDHYGPKWLHDEKTQKVIAWMPLPEPYRAEGEVVL